jgi:hypothetical protein
MNARILGMVIGSLLLVGCFSPMQRRQFIPIGSPIQASAKQPFDVQLFAKTSEVPYAYIEIGRITPEGDRYNHQSASDQISTLRALAAAHGADGVIVSKQILVKGAVEHSPEEGIVHRAEIALYSGIVIVKTSTGTVVNPAPAPGGLVSIGDLFAVPDQYLNKTVEVEGIYSRLTVGAQTTGFFLTSTVNTQLELLCAYHNIALDEASRRLLMNKPSNTPLRIEGNLVPTSQGAAKEAGLSSLSGYELAVTRVLQ